MDQALVSQASYKLIDLPTELILYILSQLHFTDLLRCKRTCKILNSVIQDNVQFRYRIQLGLNGLEVSDYASRTNQDFDDSSSLQLLNEYQNSWDNLQFKEMDIDMNTDGVSELLGNVLSQASGESSLSFTQLPSGLRGVPQRYWKLADMGIDIRDFSMDPSQNLVACLETHLFTQRYHLDIHLRTLDSGDSHPLAVNAQIDYDRLPENSFSYAILICSEYLAILCNDTSFLSNNRRNKLCVWNWKTGNLLLEVLGPLLAYSFLTDHHLAVVMKHNKGEFLVLDLESSIPRQAESLEDLVYTCSFLFPTLKETAKIWSAEIRSQPAFLWSPAPTIVVPFHLAVDKRLFAVTFTYGCSEVMFRKITFLFLLDSLLPYFYNNPDIPPRFRVPWDEWGPKCTRAIPCPAGHSFTWLRNVYGMRFVDIDHRRDANLMDEAETCVFMADFNQGPIRKAMAGSEAASAIESNRLKPVLEETSIDASESSPFAEQVITSLPYRYGELALPNGGEYEGAMISEDAILLVDGSHPDSATSFHVFSI